MKKLQIGNEKQKKAYEAIRKLGIVRDLSAFHPIICGTIPIGIDVEASDLDIVCEVEDFDLFEQMVVHLYKKRKGFRVKRLTVKGIDSVKVNFFWEGLEFELFGQSVPSYLQPAFQHMVIEHYIMGKTPHIRAQVINLKTKGYKTEPAFCKVLELEGDPYEALLQYGKKEGIV
ncbi:DUF4269 domain-containing protein [Pontibacillus yanchengensis]|uniref:DUF4269 domain-containing protein n=1 Tax=Pontibacillus yanchengensis TaxID=462910 RepID=UPI001F199B91|nr:DUF4269 domain-containing protein [Pontibacillus yanchengensis]